MAAPLALMNIALLHVEAGRSAILSYTTPLWVVPAAVFCLGERLTIIKVAGLALGLMGLLILFDPRGFDWSSPDVVMGNGLLLLASLTWAIAILIARTHLWVSTPLELSPWQMTAAAVALAIPAALSENVGAINWSLPLLGVLAFNGPIASAFCFWGALVISRELPSITASMGFLGVPVAGVLFSAVALGEPLTATLMLALACILGGIALVNLGGVRRA
jgi:drug/metabolite transporter (DMT)-like permease